MKSKSCCGFGHREVFENITERINSAVREAAEQGCEIFYTGAMGQFDELFSASVRIMKKEYRILLAPENTAYTDSLRSPEQSAHP